MTRRLAMGAALVFGACTPPPSVQAVDGWLSAYAEGDVERMVAHTAPGDRETVRAAMTAPSATSTVALALPPKPMSHELVEIERKEDGRHVVLTRVTMKNPLPYMSERVGQSLDIPKTRTRRRRFLSVRGSDGRWGVKLDLARVMARARFVRRFDDALARRDFAAAEGMLNAIPPPPDEPNAQRTKDRLPDNLRTRLEKAKKLRSARTATAAAP